MKIVETLPAASPRMGFFKAVAGWLDAAMVEFGPEGTMHYLQGSIAGRTDRLYTTGIKERQIIFGDTGPLEQAIRDIDQSVTPQLLFVSSSPVSEIIGVDIETVVLSVQPAVRAKLSAWDRVPVEGTEAQGYAAAHEKAAEYLRQNPAWGSQDEKSGCLILGLNETDWNGAADINELRRMMEAYFGLCCRNEKDGRYCLSDIPKAQCLLVIAPEAVPLAKAAEELWGTIWYECVPYGLAACEELVSALERLLERQAEPCWAAEHQEVERSLTQFQKKLEHRRQKNVFLDSRKARCPALEAFLTKELGLTVSRPSADHSALSTDGSVDRQPGLQADDLLLGSGLLCAMYPENPSLCIEYPTAGQKLLGRHIPMMGMWGAENVAEILFSIIKNRYSR